MKHKFFIPAVLIASFACAAGTKTAVVSTEPQKAELAVVMYHSFLKDSSKSGKYVITPSQFENDIIYLKDIGCSFVSVKDIKNFKHGRGSLPEKAVLITIDDGNYNNYTYIFPLLKKYNVPALISPIGCWVEKYTESGDLNPAYSIITEDNIREMFESGLVEFGNHTYNLHETGIRLGSCKLKSESCEDYRQMLTDDLLRANEVIKRSTGSDPCALVYPYGTISHESYEVARNLGFDILFSCTEGLNRLSPDDGLYLLKRYNRPAGIKSADFFSSVYK